LFLKGENTVEGRALSAIGFSLGLAHDGSAGEHTLARLFRFFGLDDGGAKGRIEQRVAGEPVARLLNRWLKAPAAEAAIDDLSRLREALASLKKSAESIVAANRILVAADQPMFLEWPLLGTSASPVRLLLSRDKKDAAPQGAPATRVEMSFETRSLGPVRVSLTLSGGLDAVIRMKEDALARMREEQAGLVEALGAVRRGATVRLAPLLDDEKALPDLSTLLTRAKGGLGRLHVTA
jgi:hypothetical protein